MRPLPLLVGVATAALLAATSAAASPPSASTGSFDPTALRPYFGGPLAEVPRRLSSGAYREAARLLQDHLKKKHAAHRPQAQFLLGLAYLGEPETALLAARLFDELVASYPLLLPYHRLHAARAYLRAGRAQEALDRAGRVPDDSVLACEARFVRAEALRRLSRQAEAESAYGTYLERCEARRYEALARRAELLTALGRHEEAIPLWRRLYLEAPLSPFGVQADRQLDRLPEAARRFSARELLGRAQVFFDNMRNPESEIAYRRVLESILPDEHDESIVCIARYHLAQSVFKQRQRPRAAALFDEAAAACQKNEDLHMKSLYQAARCHGSRGDLQRAADLFAQAEAAHPGHSYADDARLRQAEMYADLQEKLEKEGPEATCQKKTCPDYEARLTELLRTLPDLYPTGDQRAEALWRLALRAYRRRDHATAQRYLEESLRRVPRESGWDQEGRTLYWLGRIAEVGGHDQQAVQHYQRAAREYPLSFYTLMSFNRLRERWPQALAALLAELAQEPAGEETAWRFADRPLLHQPAFLRAVELLRLGLGSEAQRELQAAGLRLPHGKGYRPASPEEEELIWLAAVLYHRAGDFYRSHWIPRHSLTAHQRRYPVGSARREWQLSYPRGYEELLVPAARQNGQPEALQLAIVREESAFDPLCESFANAIGLTQMIQPTARRFSGGLPTTREALRDPAINVAIGARFLGFLWSTMQGHPALVVAGYNAGEGAVFRWLRARGDLDADVFIETIPYDETRGYTKRVLSSYLVYSWLYGEGDLASRIPLVPLRLPALPQTRAAALPEADPHRK
ncbi:MAG: transglycosylase SLT domain-containing protein [Myxococcota bacterium]|nr:transglycosylase SLT domain-containing protein [Myxococcota bacterium]